MVAPALAAAGIGAVGSVLGGLFGSSSAKKAAQLQAQTAREQIAAQQAQLAQQTQINQPTIDRGQQAESLYGGFFGLGGQEASDAALGAFRDSTGYRDTVNEALGAVNANSYARGMGNSGAALKALQDRANRIALGNRQEFTGGLGALINAGTQARGNVAGVSQNTTNAIGQISQNSADVQGNLALARGGIIGGAVQNLANIGSSYFLNQGQQQTVQDPSYLNRSFGFGGPVNYGAPSAGPFGGRF